MKTIKNQSGRSMVEMLGVLAIIGVLSIGGVAGYRYGMDQIAANKLMNFIQKFYTAMESALIDSNSKMNVICAYGNSGSGCKQQKMGQACQLFLGKENCREFRLNYWGEYVVPGLSGNVFYSGSHQHFSYQNVNWHYRTHEDGTVYLQFTNVKPSVCQKVLSALNEKVYPKLLAYSSYCNGEWWRYLENGCELETNDFGNSQDIDAICSYAPNVGDFNVMTIQFDAGLTDLIDASDEN